MMSDLLNISVDNGKYTIIQREDGSGEFWLGQTRSRQRPVLEILRYGEPWMGPLCNIKGSKMILAMAYELELLRERLNQNEQI
jgi:hypothetical protein